MLALALGKSLAEIDRMPAHELRRWQVYHSLFPFGDERADWRMGTIAAVLHNIHRGKNSEAAKPSDFMLKPPETQAQKEARWRAMRRKANPHG